MLHPWEDSAAIQPESLQAHMPVCLRPIACHAQEAADAEMAHCLQAPSTSQASTLGSVGGAMGGSGGGQPRPQQPPVTQPHKDPIVSNPRQGSLGLLEPSQLPAASSSGANRACTDLWGPRRHDEHALQSTRDSPCTAWSLYTSLCLSKLPLPTNLAIRSTGLLRRSFASPLHQAQTIPGSMQQGDLANRMLMLLHIMRPDGTASMASQSRACGQGPPTASRASRGP